MIATDCRAATVKEEVRLAQILRVVGPQRIQRDPQRRTNGCKTTQRPIAQCLIERPWLLTAVISNIELAQGASRPDHPRLWRQLFDCTQNRRDVAVRIPELCFHRQTCEPRPTCGSFILMKHPHTEACQCSRQWANINGRLQVEVCVQVPEFHFKGPTV